MQKSSQESCAVNLRKQLRRGGRVLVRGGRVSLVREGEGHLGRSGELAGGEEGRGKPRASVRG